MGLLPFLQTYAAAFFAIPAVRLFLDARRNGAIEDRNDARLQVRGACSLLLPAAGPQLCLVACARVGSNSHMPVPAAQATLNPHYPHIHTQALDVLQNASRDPALDAKLSAARKAGSRRVIGRQDIIYTTEKGADEQVCSCAPFGVCSSRRCSQLPSAVGM